jgi:hypothetical protein
VEIVHQRGYFYKKTKKITDFRSIKCATTYAPTIMPVSDSIISMVPALCLAGLIIVALIFLKSPNKPYVLGVPVDIKDDEEFEMQHIDPYAEDAGAEVDEPVDLREFTITGEDDDDPHGDDPHGDDPHGDDPHGDDRSRHGDGGRYGDGGRHGDLDVDVDLGNGASPPSHLVQRRPATIPEESETVV